MSAPLPFELGEISTDVTVYPPGQVTVLGEQLAREHVDPMLSFSSLDRRFTFHFAGALAPWPRQQDGVVLVEITPPAPGFKQLKSKAARQHGVTRNATVFSENEIHLVLKAFGMSPERLGQVVSDFQAMWNARKLVRFEWLTFDKGLWWCDCYLSKSWEDRLQGSPRRHKQQVITHVIENPRSFWQSVDSMSEPFVIDYDDFTDTFTTNYSSGAGPNWPLRYDGPGSGYLYVQDGDLRWRDDPDHMFATQWRQCIFGPYKGFETDTDNQVISTVIDTPPEWSLPTSGKVYLGGRMNRNPDDSWKGDGVFAEIGATDVQVVRYNNFVRTPMWQVPIFPPPFWGEKWKFLPGQDGSPRKFTVMRGDSVVLSRTESGTGSVISPAHRGVGGGMYAGAALFTQATPPYVRKIAGGDNNTIAQTGFLTLSNVGSEDAWPTIIFRGPGTVGIGNGPGSSDMITFGPLNDGQEVLISTHPRYRNIVDLTTTGTLTAAQRQQVEDMARRVAVGQVPPLLSWYESVFGVLPPQGNLYEQLEGRFDRPIPGVDQPSDAVTSKIAVSITGGNANSRVLASVTPMRQWPE